jgi:DNA-binding MarR family transcriptional regulator/GNAT superfamily N-acetyltransferase
MPETESIVDKSNYLPHSPRMASQLIDNIKAVRQFNRFYTRQLGLLEAHLLKSPLSLGEARVLYEIATSDSPLASDIGAALGLDRGYLSRIISSFVRRGLVVRKRSEADGRQSPLHLTPKGSKVFAELQRDSNEQVASLLRQLPGESQEKLISSMKLIQHSLEKHPPGEVTLRSHRAGDIGWVIERHSVIYTQEYGWNMKFEALVGEIASKFLAENNPRRERCWIAELDGVRVGCVFLVERSRTIAQLRLLLVEPSARGHGIGQRLVDECITFAKKAGYSRMRLWTNDVLTSARRIYQAAGFRLIEEEKHSSWGKPLTSQTWELKL